VFRFLSDRERMAPFRAPPTLDLVGETPLCVPLSHCQGCPPSPGINRDSAGFLAFPPYHIFYRFVFPCAVFRDVCFLRPHFTSYRVPGCASWKLPLVELAFACPSLLCLCPPILHLKLLLVTSLLPIPPWLIYFPGSLLYHRILPCMRTPPLP